MSALKKAMKQIQRARLNGLPLSAARFGKAPILTLGECKKLAHETAYRLEDLCSEFVGLDDGWEPWRDAIKSIKEDVVSARIL